MAKRIDFIIFRMKLRGTTVTDWAKENGHKPDTVFKTIYGKRGTVRGKGESVRIREHLQRDGFWPSDDELDAVMNG